MTRIKKQAVLIGLFRSSLLTFLAFPASADEADYVKERCDGEIEHVLADRTRVDCLTRGMAIEFDYGHKWAESVGQALHYAAHTGRRAGVVLIIESKADRRGLKRLRAVVGHYGLPIDVRVVYPD